MTEETKGEGAEVKARQLGWVSQEEFRGDQEKWIDAETFVKRGEELMPILRANNKRLQEQLNGVQSELKETRAMLSAATESIEGLKEFNSKVNKRAVEDSVKATRDAIREAREAGDVDRELELQESLREQTDALKEANRKPEKKEPPKTEPDPTVDPDWQAWSAANPWYGSNKRKTALAMGIADELRASPEMRGVIGRAFLDRVTEEVEAALGERTPPTSKVEGGGRPSGGSNGKAAYSDMSPEARDACDRIASRVVGKGKAFASEKEWREHYAREFFAQEA